VGAEASAVDPTAFWTAHCRALDGDAMSRALCGDEGTAIGRALEETLSVRAAVGVRTKIFDERIDRAIDRGVETIVSLGCGLDTRAARWAGRARWIEVDAPAVIAWKKERLADVDAAHAPTFVEADLGDESAMREVMEAAHGSMLVVLEGVLQYLAPPAALSLLSIFARRREATTLLADVGGGAWSRLFGRVSRVTRSIGAPYLTRVSNVDRFFARAGWRVIDRKCISHSFSRPLSAYLVPGWSAAACVVEAEPINEARRR
jgi:methyltransferase (TIGR00027 family)